MVYILIGYKYRIYPNKQQEELIQKTFGCVRFVYNQCLEYKKEKYETEKISLSRFDLNNWKNQFLKNEYEWLKEVDKYSLDNAVINLDSAFQKFFKEHSGYPNYKSKKNNHKSYKTNCVRNNIEVDFKKNKIKLPKLKWIKIKLHRVFDGKIKSAVISQVPSGEYYISVLVEVDNIEKYKQNNNSVGIDLGIKDLVITSNGDKFDNQKFINKYEKSLIKQQRKLAHKQNGSNNRNKQRIKVARIYKKISD